MRIPLRSGRAFEDGDREGRPGVVIVSQSLARRYWPGQDPIGKRLKIPLPPTEYHDAWLTVVGVADDARYRELTATRLDLYMSHRQSDHRPNHVVVRSRSGTAATAAAVGRVVRGMNPGLPSPGVIAMTEAVSAALAIPRFAVRVVGGFALTAVLLASLGLYGSVAASAGRRTRELAIRVVLGATPLAIARVVASDGLRPALAGMAFGVAGGLATGRVARSLLFGVGPTDGATIVVAGGLLLLVAVGASAIPATHALRRQPLETLRQI
jgi:putative ABC transport system permease protein